MHKELYSAEERKRLKRNVPVAHNISFSSHSQSLGISYVFVVICGPMLGMEERDKGDWCEPSCA
jgi:hypothetical protein